MSWGFGGVAPTTPLNPYIFITTKIEIPKAESVNYLVPPLSTKIPLQILLVEDNVVNQKVALRLLDKMGYGADVAVNGIEAIAALELQTYDLIFMDVQMPEMDGLTATREMRKRGYGRVYIVAMTANAMIGDREVCLGAGMDDYISKPISIEKIGDALMVMINSNSQRA